MRPEVSNSPNSNPLSSNPIKWFLLAGVWLQYVMFGVVANSLSPLVPIIEMDLGLDHIAMGWILGVWQLAFFVVAIPCGMLVDQIGPRKAIAIGGLFIALSAFMRSLASGDDELMLAVIVLGLGGSIVLSGGPRVVISLFSGSSRGFAMGIYATGAVFGATLVLSLSYPVLLPLLGEEWRNVMSFWGEITLLSTLIWVLISSIPNYSKNIESRYKGEIKTRIPHKENFLILIRDPVIIAILCMGSGVFLLLHSMNSWLPELLRLRGVPIKEVGLWASIPIAIGLLGSLIIPRFAISSRRYTILLILSVTAACGFYFLLFQSRGVLLGGLLVFGLARSSLVTILVLILLEQESVDEAKSGLASGLFFSVSELGGWLGPILLGVTYELSGGFDLGLYLLIVIALVISAGVYRLSCSCEKNNACL